MKKFLCLFLMTSLTALFAQEPEKEQTIRIKTVKEINGKTTVLDTTIHLAPGESASEALKELGMDAGDGNGKLTFRFEGEETESPNREKKTVVIDIRKEENTDGDIRIWQDDQSQTQELNSETYEFIDGDVDVQVETLQDGTQKMVIRQSNEEKPAVFIMKDGEIEKSIEKDVEVLIIQKEDLNPEDQEKIEAAIESGDLEAIIDELKAQGKIEGLQNQSVKVFTLKCQVELLEEADKETLKEAGLDRQSLGDDLEIDDLTFFPNPNDGKFTLRYTPAEAGKVLAEIRDQQGRILYQDEVETDGSPIEQSIDISGEAAGVYFLTLRQNQRTLTRKILMNE